jgi:hypothetical protein
MAFAAAVAGPFHVDVAFAYGISSRLSARTNCSKCSCTSQELEKGGAKACTRVFYNPLVDAEKVDG